MRNLLHSAGKIALAGPLFGAQQFLSFGQAGRSATGENQIAIVNEAMMSRCGPTASRLFETAVQVQGQAVDLVSRAASPSAGSSGGITETLAKAALSLQDLGVSAFQRPDQSEPTGWGPVPEFSDLPND